MGTWYTSVRTQILHKNINGFNVDNQWVIPYNRDLIVQYDAYINVQRCAHSKVIKYLFKYIHKGHNRAIIMFHDNIVQPNIIGH